MKKFDNFLYLNACVLAAGTWRADAMDARLSVAYSTSKGLLHDLLAFRKSRKIRQISNFLKL